MERDLPDLPTSLPPRGSMEAHGQSGKRVLGDLAVVDSFSDGLATMKGYKDLHHRTARAGARALGARYRSRRSRHRRVELVGAVGGLASAESAVT